jgi:GT2 family glycosyltransferase
MAQLAVDLAIITHNSLADVGLCIESAAEAVSRIIIVDNASSDGTLDFLRDRWNRHLLLANSKNTGYAAAVNQGAAASKSEFLVLANADVAFAPGSIEGMLDFIIKRPRVGVVGPQQVFPDGSWQRSYGDSLGLRQALGDLMSISQIRHWLRRRAWPRRIDKNPVEVGYLDGAVLMVRRVAFDSVDGFDEGLHFYGEDVDFCFRLRRAGWGVFFLPTATVAHVRGASSTSVQKSPEPYLRALVKSKRYLAAKFLSPQAQKWYERFERWHATKMLVVYRMLCFVSSRSKRAIFCKKFLSFQTLLGLWREPTTAQAEISFGASEEGKT